MNVMSASRFFNAPQPQFGKVVFYRDDDTGPRIEVINDGDCDIENGYFNGVDDASDEALEASVQLNEILGVSPYQFAKIREQLRIIFADEAVRTAAGDDLDTYEKAINAKKYPTVEDKTVTFTYP